MKKDIKIVKNKYSKEISIAKANGFDGVMIPLDCDYDPHCLNNMDDDEYIQDIACECGWGMFVTIDFIHNNSKIVNMYEDFAA